MIALFTKWFGDRLALPILIGLVIALIIFGLAAARCVHEWQGGQEAKQTTKSANAITNAAVDAIGTIENRSRADQAIDAATDQTRKDISNASDPSDVRRAVVNGLCSRPEYKRDPACTVR